jgi:hypothetical protein
LFWIWLEHLLECFFDLHAALFADDWSAAVDYFWSVFGVLCFAG